MKNTSKASMGLVIAALFILITPVQALMNPSSVYCKRLGYDYVMRENEDGTVGYCYFSKDEFCEAWSFIQGKCGEQYSYCATRGYQTVRSEDSEKCKKTSSPECRLCILGDGSMIESSQAALEDTSLGPIDDSEDLQFCGDGKCGGGEHKLSCPQDCPNKEPPESLKGIKTIKLPTSSESMCGDGFCESPETEENCPGDCQIPADYTWLIYLAVALVGVGLFFWMKNKEKNMN